MTLICPAVALSLNSSMKVHSKPPVESQFRAFLSIVEDPMIDISHATHASAEHTVKHAEVDGAAAPDAPRLALSAEMERSVVLKWLIHDIPYIAMLLLALAGVVFRLPALYWIILFPVFAIISIAEGRNRFDSRKEHAMFVIGIGLNWAALLLAVYLLYSGGVAGVMNANANSLAMMILLALGTFCAGVQARIWQLGAVGALLFLAVPALGWLDQSPLLLTAATVVIVAMGGGAWWLTSRTMKIGSA
jgi:hypothetical protein